MKSSGWITITGAFISLIKSTISHNCGSFLQNTTIILSQNDGWLKFSDFSGLYRRCWALKSVLNPYDSFYGWWFYGLPKSVHRRINNTDIRRAVKHSLQRNTVTVERFEKFSPDFSISLFVIPGAPPLKGLNGDVRPARVCFSRFLS